VLLFAIGGALGGFAIGGRFDSGHSSAKRAQSSTPIVVGGVVLGVLGYFVGQARAFHLRLLAQTALCQVKIEQNTRNRAAPPA
jgi:hypothetical protein